jgi:hypothetical protein
MHGNIHIKVEYPEAVGNKKNMLLIEKSLLEIVRHMRVYDILRKKEFLTKTQIKKDFGHLIALISAIEAEIPKGEAEFTREHYKKEVKVKEIKRQMQKKFVEQKKSEIERQIDDIRSRLSQLG